MSLELLNGVSFKSLVISLSTIFIVSRFFKFVRDLRVRQEYFQVRLNMSLMSVIPSGSELCARTTRAVPSPKHVWSSDANYVVESGHRIFVAMAFLLYVDHTCSP